MLFVERKPTIATAFASSLPSGHCAVTAHRVADALKIVDEAQSLAAVVVDFGLIDGTGIEVVTAVRARSQATPVLVLTGALSPRLVNQVNALRAQIVCKPDHEPNLANFFADLERALRDGNAKVRHAAMRLHLTNREQDIVMLSLSGVPRGRLAEVMSITENTLKKYVRSVLRKTSQSSLSEAVWYVRSAARSGQRENVG